MINCRITFTTPISGPLHLTDCHQTTIISASDQLRVHDCNKVTFHIHVASGPIIENCQGMDFYGDFILKLFPKKQNVEKNKELLLAPNLFWDVKDFCWLKNFVQSPNFRVVKEPYFHNTASVSNQERVPKDNVFPTSSGTKSASASINEDEL